MRTEPEAWVPGLQAGVIQCAAVFEDRVVLVGRAYAGHNAATGAQRDPAQLDVPGDGPADPLDTCWHRLAGDRPPRKSGGTASSCFHRATAGRPAFHCRRSRRSPRSACINPGTPAGRYPCRTTATRAHATEWLTTLRHLRPGLRRGGHSWSQSCGCARYSRASLIAPMSDRCGLFAGGAEAAALSQLGVPGSGAAGLRTRKIRNPGSLLSLS